MRVVIAILAIAAVLLGVAIFRLETSKQEEPVPAVVKEEAPPTKEQPEPIKAPVKTPAPVEKKTPPAIKQQPPPKTEEPLHHKWGHVIKLKR